MTNTKQTNILRDMREAEGIKVGALAYVLGVDNKTLYNWEHEAEPKPFQVLAYRGAIDQVIEDRRRLFESATSITRRFPTIDQPALFDLAA